ncbi:dUTP diphosphatase [Periweissella beninensis]|uniref:dUTP diphosphatase n=1 Tax=Periweissella beninensis TaxID=504936 RepID=A0ABT0VGB8_9LACO|nr:dUTP diphosphatase [Periweissella beninensis]MBM7544604.1 dUTP pyrophosphatase [Periweissella beninensis]MCM2436871.1 dUTP diphosphatase [Periweissella beninensis]MCT4395871.1 dUTP diphosphatase [Periweissella beninensis]
MKRGFEIVSKYLDQNVNLPKRATNQAAGYDFEVAIDYVVPSIWKYGFLKALKTILQEKIINDDQGHNAQQIIKPVLVPTGIKAYMEKNEVLMLINRSSGPLKKSLILPNAVGVIDADYYNNEKNEGEIFVQLLNFGLRDVTLRKGERIAQGIFMPFLLTDNDAMTSKQVRQGGFGSSDNNVGL